MLVRGPEYYVKTVTYYQLTIELIAKIFY